MTYPLGTGIAFSSTRGLHPDEPRITRGGASAARDEAMRRRVLIADPDPLLRAAYAAFLVPEGFEVATAATAAECLAEARRRTPDLLVIDPELPGGLGGMRDDPALPEVPALILTRRSPAVVAEVRPPLRGYAVLMKPVAPGELARLVSAVSEPEAETAP